jgi:UDP-N-acetylmuramoyl-L-alanyl-D-glutamate--2,6-diaminopimelate ligase
MKLGDLVAVVADKAVLSPEAAAREVSDLAQDSRQVKPGSLFIAVRGFHSDGHQFIAQAAQQGAAAVIAEQGQWPKPAGNTPVVLVPDSRRALAQLSAAFYGYPSRRLRLIGITGTNGKTTTTYLIKAVLEATGSRAGLIGTIDYRIGGRVYPAPNTTPESLDLQRLLAEMVEFGAKYCVMEVSSHALALGRTEGCEFDAAGFTNLTQDHLDFHKDMGAYLQAKLRLFTGLSPEACAVVNIDDPSSAAVISATKAKVITTGFSERADVRPLGAIEHGINGLAFEALVPQGTVRVESSLVGKHNVYNILTAIGVCTALGIADADISRGLSTMRAVPGRMETVDEGQPFGVVVDYAHTEDALVRLLEAVREITPKRVITVFGCGGDRDRTKRPKMGAAAIAGSDVVIVTSDNPRMEDPSAIISEIEAGFIGRGAKVSQDAGPRVGSGKKPYYVLPDRSEAVAAAVRMALPGDVVVLAGKGHEDYQLIGEKKAHFDDREAARAELRNIMADRGSRTP